MAAKTRRPHGTGSVYQAHDHETCPPLVDGPAGDDGKPTRVRADHKCQGRWMGSVELGWNAKGIRRRKRVVGVSEKAVRAKIKEALRTFSEDDDAVVGAKPTVRTWAEQWLQNTVSRLRPTSWATNRSCVNLWIIPTIGHRRLEALTPADIRSVTRAIITAGRKPSTAQRTQVVLEKMLRDALLEGHKVPQRALMVEAPSRGESDRDAIELPDALAILAVASARPDASRWVAAFLQALRPAEALGLCWSLVNFDDHEMEISWQLKALPYNVPRDRSSGFRVPDGYVARRLDGALHLVRPKTTAGKRVIPMVPWMESALLAWREICPTSPHGLVWPRPDGRPGLDSLDRAGWATIVDAARVARVDEDGRGRRYELYEARHTTATLLREAGVDDETITAIMGHSTILSSKAYMHTSSKRTRAALNDLAATLGLTPPGDDPAPELPAAG